MPLSKVNKVNADSSPGGHLEPPDRRARASSARPLANNNGEKSSDHRPAPARPIANRDSEKSSEHRPASARSLTNKVSENPSDHLQAPDRKVRPSSGGSNRATSPYSTDNSQKMNNADVKGGGNNKKKTHKVVRQSSDAFHGARLDSSLQDPESNNDKDKSIDENPPNVKLGSTLVYSEYHKLDNEPLEEFYFEAVNKSECDKVSCKLSAEDHLHIDRPCKGKRTHLQLAIHKDQQDMVKHLVRHHDASLQWEDEEDDGATILHYAAKLSNKNTSFVKFLLDRMDISWLHKVSKGTTPVVIAIEHGGVEVALEMLKRIEHACLMSGAGDKDPLDLAIRRSNGLPIVKSLVEKKLVDIKRGDEGNTHVHRMAFAWNADVLEILVGADSALAFESSQDGATPLIKVAMNNGKHKTNRSVKCAQILVSKCKADLNATAKSHKGWTALHFAVEHGNFKLVDYLIQQKGIEVDTYDTDGKTPLMYSVLQEKLAIAKLLLEKGKANPNLHKRNPDGKDCGNCVELVAHLGNPDLMKLILEQPGIDVAEKNESGDTPLHTIIQKCSFTSSIMITEMYRQTAVLLASHADEVINVQDRLGRTPLHVAIVTDGAYPVIKRMLCCCTNVHKIIDQKDENGYTPLHLAVQLANSSSHLALIRLLLLQYGAALSFANDGKTPLHIALEQQEEEIVALFVEHRNVWDFVDNDVLHDMVVNMPHLLVKGLDNNIKAVSERSSSKYKIGTSDESLKESPEKLELDGASIVNKVYVPEDGEMTEHNSSVSPKLNPTKKEQKFHHHLRLIAESDNVEVCMHPVVRAVWRNKWKTASIVYFSYFAYYLAFVWAVSGYMLSAHPPYNSSHHTHITQNGLVCDNQLGFVNSFTISLFIILLTVTGFIIKIIQIIYSSYDYLSLLNLSDFITFMTAMGMLLDLDGCRIHRELQWIAGVVCVFLSWMNLLFYLRKMPELGIYVVMIGMVLNTFIKFFLVFFLFILAFAIGFTLLQGNQFAFQHPGYSIIKTWVMMIGEMDFTDMFHAFRQDSSPESQLHFETASYCLYAVFLVIMSLIIMNLLTGLAVSDVTSLLEDSLRYMRLLRVNSSLDVEMAMPAWMHKKLYKSSLELSMGEPEPGFNFRKKVFTFLDNLYFGALSIERIREDSEAVIKRNKDNRAKEFASKVEASQAEEVGELKNKIDELDRKIAAAVGEIRDVTSYLKTFLAAQSKG